MVVPDITGGLGCNKELKWGVRCRMASLWRRESWPGSTDLSLSALDHTLMRHLCKGRCDVVPLLSLWKTTTLSLQTLFPAFQLTCHGPKEGDVQQVWPESCHMDFTSRWHCLGNYIQVILVFWSYVFFHSQKALFIELNQCNRHLKSQKIPKKLL